MLSYNINVLRSNYLMKFRIILNINSNRFISSINMTCIYYHLGSEWSGSNGNEGMTWHLLEYSLVTLHEKTWRWS